MIEHPVGGSVDLGVQFSDPVSLLWFTPITAAERELAMRHEPPGA